MLPHFLEGEEKLGLTEAGRSARAHKVIHSDAIGVGVESSVIV